MKTIEQKAKAYDEALKRARQIHDGNPSSGTAMVVCEQIFPELAESEDERMRELTIALLSTARDKGFYELANSINKAIVWLEKQKEQKPAECIPDSIKFDEGFKTGREVGFREGVESVKPAEWSRQPIIDALTKWSTEKIAPLHKKSLDGTITEREEMFMAALLEIRSFVNSPDFQIGKDTSAEWSEEDERMLTDISWAIRYCAYDDKKKERVMKWFNDVYRKSLRPSWKPSKYEELNTCPFYSDGYGCDISPMKKCEYCERRPH